MKQTHIFVMALVFHAVALTAWTAAFAANGTAETGKVFGEARRVSDADNGAMAKPIEDTFVGK